MKVVLVGASGNAGSRLLNELVNRGHQVTGIVRHPENIPQLNGVNAVGTNGSKASLTNVMRDHDAVVSSVKFLDLDPDILVPAVIDSGVTRYVVVGGAGSLLHADGIEEVNSEGFPDFAKPNSLRGTYMLDLLKKTDGLEWSYISPSRMFTPGERTGKFRYGSDHMLFDAEGKSAISFEDFALALVDELESPKYIKQRFTIGY